MFSVLFAYHWEYNFIKRLLDAKCLYYTIIVLPDYRPARPQHVGVNGFIILLESNKIVCICCLKL